MRFPQLKVLVSLWFIESLLSASKMMPSCCSGEKTLSSVVGDGRAKRGTFPPRCPFIRMPSTIHEGGALMVLPSLKALPPNTVTLALRWPSLNFGGYIPVCDIKFHRKWRSNIRAPFPQASLILIALIKM